MNIVCTFSKTCYVCLAIIYVLNNQLKNVWCFKYKSVGKCVGLELGQ